MGKKTSFTISGLGCGVVDHVYQNIDFTRPEILPYLSTDNHNGLVFGEATLIDDIESYTGKNLNEILYDITKEKEYTPLLGGVAAATLIGASQLTVFDDIDVYFYINLSNDKTGEYIFQTIQKTPLLLDKTSFKTGRGSITYALCGIDKYGEGTRTFITEPHTDMRKALLPEQLDEDFFNSNITVFSCVHWEPKISAVFTDILKKCQASGALTIVGTASDPMMRGKQKWVLGDSDAVYQYIDLLIFDKAEALYYSGASTIEGASENLKKVGAKAFIITDGTHPVYVYAAEGVFKKTEQYIPIAGIIDIDKKDGKLPIGDTVGCGDNFAGGVIASAAQQMKHRKSKIDLVEAVLLGNVNGGITSTVIGGTYNEKRKGEKLGLVKNYLKVYKRQFMHETL